MKRPPRSSGENKDGSAIIAAEAILRSLRSYGVEYLFANYGTDHTPVIEATNRARENDPESVPKFIICPHETVAMSAAHGYAISSGQPQAVLVHVDVGTQNLGAMMHNAHRGHAPIFVMSGLAPVSNGTHPGARDNYVHYLQDIFNQPGIVDQYCRWTQEYRPPMDPDELVFRGLERATATPNGPVYVTATREALEEHVSYPDTSNQEVRSVQPSGADSETVSTLAERISIAEAPLVITSRVGGYPFEQNVSKLVEFAETAGAGVVEHSSTALCFPWDHNLHVGFTPESVVNTADLLVLADTDVPWVPFRGEPNSDIPIVQLDPNPTKPEYPKWDFTVDWTIQADAISTLAAVTEKLDPTDGDVGRETWHAVHNEEVTQRAEHVCEQREQGRLTAPVVADTLNEIANPDTIFVDESVTSSYTAVRPHLSLSEPGSYFGMPGSGLGWCGGAPLGVKLANPNKRVVSLVGDGSYIFGNPTASSWVQGRYSIPVLTIIFNNSGWNAVKTSTVRAHPNQSAEAADVPESQFSPRMDLTNAVEVVDSYTETVSDVNRLPAALDEATNSVDNGIPAVLDVHIEPI